MKLIIWKLELKTWEMVSDELHQPLKPEKGKVLKLINVTGLMQKQNYQARF